MIWMIVSVKALGHFLFGFAIRMKRMQSFSLELKTVLSSKKYNFIAFFQICCAFFFIKNLTYILNYEVKWCRILRIDFD